MVRVVVVAFCTCMLAGCSLGPSAFSFGFNGGASAAPDTGTQGSFAGGPTTNTVADEIRGHGQPGKRVAALDPSRKGKNLRRAAAPGDKFANARLVPSEALRMVNTYRKENGLRPLKLNPLLTKAARAHSQDLSRWDRISHYGSDGSNPWDRVRRTGFKARIAAENVGTGQATLAEVFEGWKKSPGHNKNLLLGGATQMGIALVYDPKTEFKTFWTLVLGTPL
jgi:uncharacterized protein YkwD